MGCCGSLARVHNQPPIEPEELDVLKSTRSTDATAFSLQATREQESDSFECSIGEYEMNGYVFVKRLGRGASSVVVAMRKGGVVYAVKMCDIKSSKVGFINKVTHDPKEEAAILKRFDHPNIVKIYDLIEDKDAGKLFIVMEYLSGPPVTNISDKSEQKTIFMQVVKALEYSHYQRIAHRDVKLDNVMRHQDGSCRLLDFGISVFLPEGTSEIPSEMKGTPAYLAPECFSKSSYDPFLADIWSLGCLLFNLVYHIHPFKGSTFFELQSNIVNCRYEIPEGIERDEECEDLLKRILCVEPSQRLSLSDILCHPWLSDVSGIKSDGDTTIPGMCRANSLREADGTSVREKSTDKIYRLITAKERMKSVLRLPSIGLSKVLHS